MEGENSINKIQFVALVIVFLLVIKLLLIAGDAYEYTNILDEPEFKSKWLDNIDELVYGLDHSVFFLIGIYISKIMLFILHSMAIRSEDIDSSYQDQTSLNSDLRTNYRLSETDSKKIFYQSIETNSI